MIYTRGINYFIIRYYILIHTQQVTQLSTGVTVTTTANAPQIKNNQGKYVDEKLFIAFVFICLTYAFVILYFLFNAYFLFVAKRSHLFDIPLSVMPAVSAIISVAM